MGGPGSQWLAVIGLLSLALLALTGLIGGLVLANNGREVPPWLSSFIGGVGTTFGMVILVLYRGNSNGGPPKTQ